MRTTIRIDDDLLKRAKRVAVEEGRSLTSLIEEGLALVVHRKQQPSMQRERVVLEVSTAGGGVLPGVDLSNNAAVEDILNSE